MFSMAAGEYLSSKSQREIFEAQIAGERDEVVTRPGEAQAEVAYMFEEDGLPAEEAAEVSRIVSRHPDVLLRTMVEKELSLHVEEHAGSPMQGALIMGGVVRARRPRAHPPLPAAADPAVHLGVAGGDGVVLFGVGVLKARWTRRSPLRSGLEILAIGARPGSWATSSATSCRRCSGPRRSAPDPASGHAERAHHPVGLVAGDVADERHLPGLLEGQGRLHGARGAGW